MFTEAVAPERAARLLSLGSFSDIIVLVVAGDVAPLYWESATSPDLIGCHRASFDLVVRREAYDAFFNAPAGYRGQYAASEAQGERANRELLAALRPKLLVAAASHAIASTPKVVSSLRGVQAKVWIVESEVEDQLTAPAASINFPQWQFNEPYGQGLRAPVGTKLEVKGAWINESGDEVENPHKRDRSRNIYRTGESK